MLCSPRVCWERTRGAFANSMERSLPANSDPVIANSPIHQPCLIVLCGPPGSGKSEWAGRNRQGVVVIGQDEVIECITPAGFDHVFRPVYAAAERAAARAGLAAGFTVIIDRTNRTRTLREIWIQIANEANAPAVA